MSMPTEELSRWVRTQLEDVTEDGSISRFEVYHAIEGEGVEMLGRIKVRDDADPDDVVQSIWDAASEDVSTRMSGRMQRYVAVSFRGNESDPDARRPFLLAGKAPLGIAGGDTEGPTIAGSQAQQMRHNEQLQKSLMMLTEMTSGRLARDLETERRLRMKLEDERSTQFELLCSLQDRKHEREIELKREEAKAARHEQLMGMLMTLLPLAASKFIQGSAGVAVAGAGSTGAHSLPASKARDTATHEFLKNLTEEELMGAVQALKLPNQLAIMELYKTHVELENDGVKTVERKAAEN